MKRRYYLSGNGADCWTIDLLRPHHAPEPIKQFHIKDLSDPQVDHLPANNAQRRNLLYLKAKALAENYLDKLNKEAETN